MLPGCGRQSLEQFHYRVPETELERFAGLVGVGISGLSRPDTLLETNELDDYASKLAELFTSVIQIVGKEDHNTCKSAFLVDCRSARSLSLASILAHLTRVPLYNSLSR